MNHWGKLLFMALVAVWVSLGGPPAKSQSQAADEQCSRFEEAAKISGDQLARLTLTRGYRYEPQPLPNDLRGAILAYIGFKVSATDARDNGLIFYLRQGDRVCAYFWRHGVRTERKLAPGHTVSSSEDRPTEIVSVLEPDAVFRLPVDNVERLTDLIETVRGELASGANAPQRSPRRRSDPLIETTRGAAPLSGHPGRSQEERAALLAQLSRILFGPTGHQIEQLANLTIVPALNIGTVPFGALDPNGDGTPLVRSTALNVEASLNEVAAGRLFAIAPEIAPQTIAGDPDASRDPEWIFPRLPGAAAEARSIAARFQAAPIIGSDATVSQVTRHLGEASYIHIAAHGVSSVTDPVDGSFLAMSDGRLTARAIQHMRLKNNPLVVLSACQTGLGNPLDAGIVGLARAFILAGASSVIVSLWNVDDEATSWIMTRFVDHLATQPPGTALRLAQDEARERWPEPAKWGAFVLFGSRIIVLPPPDLDAHNTALRLEVMPMLRRSRDREKMEPTGHTGVPVVKADDELHLDIANHGRKPIDLDVLYADSGGTIVHILSERIQPGEAEQLGLVQFTDETVGRERAIIVARESQTASEPLSLTDFEGIPPMMLAYTLASPAGLREMLPGGIHRISDFGTLVASGSFLRPSRHFERASAGSQLADPEAGQQVLDRTSERSSVGGNNARGDQPLASGVLVLPFEVTR